jgi:4-hydroxy-4-methyl-2-oxoglutarate aldolase
VLDNAGRTDCTVWGDILTSVAHERGIAGTVVSGVCRDMSKALALGYPIFSVGRFMRTGKDRVEVVEVGGSIEVGGAQVKAGDLVVGDADGVVIVPRSIEREVADIAQRISDVEDEILAEALRPEGTLRAAREHNGYHRLQRAAEEDNR